jgi:steroid 5-alpha reductase family enzyme
MLSLLQQYEIVAAAAVLGMFILWLVQVRTRDAGVVDMGWAALLGLSAIFAGATGKGELERRAAIAVIGGIWGLRLAWHILTDRVLKGHEDGRYLELRERFGARINLFHLAFFQFQAILVILLAGPFLLAASATRAAPSILDIAGVGLWIVGIAGEAIADEQLKRFKKRPESKGKTCRAGLWNYSRHPNYFFEWLMWCAYALIAVQAVWGWAALLAPAFMLLLIVKVTGIPPTEKRAIRSRGEEYRKYQRETSAFIPWFPKREGAGA